MSANSVSKDPSSYLTFSFACLPEKKHIVEQIISIQYAKNSDFNLANLKNKTPQSKTNDFSSSERSIAQIFSEVMGQSNPQRKRRETRELFNELLEKNQIEQALEFAKMIPDPLTRSFVLEKISHSFANQREIDSALQIAEMIVYPMQRSHAIKYISHLLLIEQKTNYAFKIAKNIPNPLIRSFAMRDISEVLTEDREYDQALYIIQIMPDGQEKDFAFENITQALVKEHRTQEALEITGMIKSRFIRSKALKEILGISLKREEMEKELDLISHAKPSEQPFSLSALEFKDTPNLFSIQDSSFAEEMQDLEYFIICTIEELTKAPNLGRYLEQKRKLRAFCDELYLIAEIDSELAQASRWSHLQIELNRLLQTIDFEKVSSS